MYVSQLQQDKDVVAQAEVCHRSSSNMYVAHRLVYSIPRQERRLKASFDLSREDVDG
jgi:hypothetical protein